MRAEAGSRPVCSDAMGRPPRFGGLSSIHVLVVEDNDDAGEILYSQLTYLGAFVSTAASAHGALNVLAQVRADVVVCDVYLGDEDALWFIREARQHQPSTPFIAVSGQDYDEQEMRRAGFTAALTKPVPLDLLVSRILSAVGC